MPIGNDIVDLGDPENRPGAIHPRFDERVFASAERERLTAESAVLGVAAGAAGAAAHRTRWLLWAAKESAFKAARKLDPGVRFLPRQFRVELVGDAVSSLGEGAVAVVRHAAGRFEVFFTGAEDWVHAVAIRQPGPFRSIGCGPEVLIGRVSRGGTAASRASDLVRAMARSAIGSALSIVPSEIEIAMAGGPGRRTPPVALWKGNRLPIDLSLSHHGRFLACAWSRSGRAAARRLR